MCRLLIPFLFITNVLAAQSLTEVQQKALNNYIDWANQVTSDASPFIFSLESAYEQVLRRKEKSYYGVRSFTCPIDRRETYYEASVQTSFALPVSSTNLNKKAEVLLSSYRKIDETCKAIEIYYRLEDYKRDDFKKLEELIHSSQSQWAELKESHRQLVTEVENLIFKLQPYNATSPYHKADKQMRDMLKHEKALLDLWSLNINSQTHTGWPVEKVQQHVLQTTKLLEGISTVSLKYPSSSMYKSFLESIESLQETKRNGIDSYTFEKQSSDKHSNQVYNDLINYYSNAAVSFHNAFTNVAKQDGFRGINTAKYFPSFEIRTEAKQIKIEVTPFKDRPIADLKINPVSTLIPSNIDRALSNYLDFINEGVRQVQNCMNPMRNLNGSASHGKARMKEGKHVNIDYYYKNFTLPITLYQKTLDQSVSIPAPLRSILNAQAEVLYDILIEINQWNNMLLAEAGSKQLLRDSLDHVYSVLSRYKELAEAFDLRKERLFLDVRRFFESYKPANSKSSWYVSGSALLALMDANREELFKAKKYLQGDHSEEIRTDKIEKLSREIITNEYTNLTGIEKLGRSNGNCPYTPYEDLPKYSLNYINALTKAKEGKGSDPYYRHPYNVLVNNYNQTLVYNYQQFISLSKVPLLDYISQLEIFTIVEPEKPSAQKPDEIAVITSKPETNAEVESLDQKKLITGGVIHDTVRITDIIRIETVRQDTVYISKVDTVFVGVHGENTLSMEGYASNNMILLLDVSGSMNAPEKLPLLKKSVLLLLKIMRSEDEVSIVTYSGKARVALQPTSFKEEDKIKKVIESLKSEGKTDGNAGLRLAYEVADKNYIRGGNNRIILATDGEFPISEESFKIVKKFANEDIFISVFNFGKTSQSVKNLQQIAALGRGNYEYITSANADIKLITEVKAKKRK